jgi:hypothetical protein
MIRETRLDHSVNIEGNQSVKSEDSESKSEVKKEERSYEELSPPLISPKLNLS